MHKKRLSGQFFIILSIITRFSVIILFCTFALWTSYLNLKVGYNNPRLVELSSGKAMRIFYEQSDSFFSLFGDPMKIMQTNGGMIWSFSFFGLPITDPIAVLSVLIRNHSLELAFVLGLTIPLSLALLFGRVFCNYICPASLIFFTIARIKRLLSSFLYFPKLKINRALAWGILFGGLITATLFGHGIWTILLPYLLWEFGDNFQNNRNVAVL